jgi:AcrR family transcriptional regulator
MARISSTSLIGKRPQQARSRERVARILEASTALMREGGVNRLTMSAVARGAKIPIGSLYQYFPSKSALVHRMFKDRLVGYHGIAITLFEKVRSRAAYANALRTLMHWLYAANRDDPLMQEVWSGAQADRQIRHMHVKDNDFYVALLIRAALRVGSALSRRQLTIRMRVVNEMWDGAVRMSITERRAAALRLLDDSVDVGVAALRLTTRP